MRLQTKFASTLDISLPTLISWLGIRYTHIWLLENYPKTLVNTKCTKDKLSWVKCLLFKCFCFIKVIEAIGDAKKIFSRDKVKTGSCLNFLKLSQFWQHLNENFLVNYTVQDSTIVFWWLLWGTGIKI